MFETYRMLGREREKELEAEAARLRPLTGRPINRISAVIVAVIVAAFAFGATMAPAEVWPESSTGAQLTTQPAHPDLIERWVASHQTHVLAPPDLIERWVASHKTHVLAPPDLIERWVASHKTHVLAPDDRIRARPAEASIQVSPPDLIERWVASHERQAGQTQPASSSHTGDAFDWRAALVGASTTAALVLALAIGIGIARRSRIRSAAA